MNKNGRTTNDPKEDTIKFRISIDKSEKLKSIAKRKGISVSQLMRDYIDKMIKEV